MGQSESRSKALLRRVRQYPNEKMQLKSDVAALCASVEATNRLLTYALAHGRGSIPFLVEQCDCSLADYAYSANDYPILSACVIVLTRQFRTQARSEKRRHRSRQHTAMKGGYDSFEKETLLPALHQLVSLGAEVASTDAFGRTVLHEAATRHLPRTTHFLLSLSGFERPDVPRIFCAALERPTPTEHDADPDFDPRALAEQDDFNLIDLKQFDQRRAVLSRVERELRPPFKHDWDTYDDDGADMTSGSDVAYQRLLRLLLHQTERTCTTAALGDVACVLPDGSDRVTDVGIVLARDETPLHVAARAAPAWVVATLLNYGCPVNALDSCGRTPLHLAVSYGAPTNVIRTLLEAGADATKRDNDGGDALLALFRFSNAGQRHVDLDDIDERPLVQQELDTMQLLLDAGATVTCKDKNGMTLLHYAIKNAFPLDTVQSVLTNLRRSEPNVDLDRFRFSDGSTLLHAALKAEHVSLDLVRLLVHEGCSPYLHDADGYSCVGLALRREEEELAWELNWMDMALRALFSACVLLMWLSLAFCIVKAGFRSLLFVWFLLLESAGVFVLTWFLLNKINTSRRALRLPTVCAWRLTSPYPYPQHTNGKEQDQRFAIDVATLYAWLVMWTDDPTVDYTQEVDMRSTRHMFWDIRRVLKGLRFATAIPLYVLSVVVILVAIGVFLFLCVKGRRRR